MSNDTRTTTPHREQYTAMTDNPTTAPCRKCHTPIRPDAQRCPACGYDPDPGALGTLVFWVVMLPWAAVGLLLVVGAVAGTITGSLSTAATLGALLASVVVFGLPWWYVARHWKRTRLTATQT